MTESMSIDFDLGNAAFEGERSRQLEIYRILGDIREKVINGHEDGIIKDVNGNTVGKWAYDPCEEDDGNN